MTKITQLLVLLTIGIVGMVGIATADPCPNPNGAEWNQDPDGTISVLYTLDADKALHVTVRSGLDEGTINGVPGIREVCVYFPSTMPKSAKNEWHLWPEDGAVIKRSGVIEFKGPERGGENNNIPLDTNLNPVGVSFFDVTPDLGEAKVLLHINDIARCNPARSCFIVPYKNRPPIPELSTVVLTCTGLLGIVLMSRKYKNR